MLQDLRPKEEDVDDDGEDDEDLDDDDADGKDLGNGIDSCWWLRSFPACNPSPLHCLALDTTMLHSTTMRTKLQTVRCTDYCYAYCSDIAFTTPDKKVPQHLFE